MALGVFGRETELRRVAEVLTGDGAIALVGPAGIGKTTLAVTAVADRAHARGAGLSLLSHEPYAALEQAVRAGLRGEPEQVAGEVLTRVQGKVLVVEDLHWVAAETVEVLALLVGAVPLVLTTRPDLDDRHRALLRAVERVDVGPMAPGAAARLARRLHPGLDDAARSRLLALSGGIPLLIERLVGDDQHVAPTLRAAVAHRLRTLDAADRELLGMLALVGRPAEPELLRSPMHGVADLVRVQDDGTVVFRHAALAEGVVELLDPDQRRRLHATLADRLDDAAGAVHDLHAGRPARAAERASAAAASATPAERAVLLGLAAEAAEATGEAGAAHRVRAAEACVAAGRWRQAVEHADRVVTDDPLVAAGAALHRGRARWYAGDVERARADLAAAAALVEGRHPEQETTVALERAFLEVRDRVAGAVDLARDAVAAAERTGLHITRARSTLGAALLYEGHPDWERTLLEAVDGARAEGDADLEATTAYHLVSGLGFHGRLTDAVVLGRGQIERTREAGLGWWTTHFEVAELVQRSQISTDPAALVADAERLLAALPVFRNRFQVHLVRILGLIDLGRDDDAVAAAQAMEDEHTGSDEWSVVLAAAWAEIAWHRNDAVLARDALALGREVIGAYFGLHLLTERTAAHVLVAHGEPVEPVLPPFAMPTFWPALHELEGLRRLQSGDRSGAVDELRRAADQFEAMSITRWAVRAGVAAIDAGCSTRAREVTALRRHYLDLARSSGLVGTLRRLGFSGHAALTPTEEAVLRHVASGATTKEVAARLGMAPGTVDQHVEAARRKLGAATRLEAALQVGP